ncbi:MAG: hypothetical protein DDT34_02537 [Firmicutes bacterium]|nr:hypothetical protein [Bacillota bacterium]
MSFWGPVRFLHSNLCQISCVVEVITLPTTPLVIPAPPGVILDPLTGLLNVSVTLQPIGAPQLRDVTVLPDKIINQGVVPALLLVNVLVVFQSLEIPFQGVIEKEILAEKNPLYGRATGILRWGTWKASMNTLSGRR